MRAMISALVAGAIGITTLVPSMSAAESRCDIRLFVFSRNSANVVGSADYNAYACRAVLPDGTHVVADGPYDFRLITPGSDIISVRYAEDDVPGTPGAIRARLSGLGMRNKLIFLGRSDASLTGDGSSYVYDGPDITIDPQAQGCLKVDAWHEVKKKVKVRKKVVKRSITVFRVSTTYHTFDTVSC